MENIDFIWLEHLGGAIMKRSTKDKSEGIFPEIIAEDITSQRVLENYHRHLAATDALTGLPNYCKLSETLDSEIRRSDRTSRAFAVLVFDLNGMKRINDSHGHLVGD